MDFQIREYECFNREEVLALYESVGWTAYTEKPEMLKQAFAGSLEVTGAYEDGRLVGLIRVIGDGASILYIQDLLVHPDFQNRGIGTALLGDVMKRYSHVYQKCLITDDSEKSVKFYQRMGFMLHEQYGCCGLIKVY